MSTWRERVAQAGSGNMENHDHAEAAGTARCGQDPHGPHHHVSANHSEQYSTDHKTNPNGKPDVCH